MSNYKKIVINENELNKLVIDINDYSIQIRRVFNEIESIVYETKNIYNSESFDNYFEKFEDFKQNFNILINNLNTYKKDLNIVKNSFKKQEGILSEVFVKKTTNALNQ